MNPKKVIPFFQNEVLTVNNNDSIIETIKLMKKNFFSQIPVLDDENKFIDLLTNNTVARWLGDLEDQGGGKLIMNDTPIINVLNYKENYVDYKFISKDLNIINTLDFFYNESESRNKIESLLITHSGNKNEKILGIITHWDIPEIYKSLNDVQ